MKRFFRVGIVLAEPWAWIDGIEDNTNPKLLTDESPNRGLKGYCIDLLQKLADHMKFDYEIIPAAENKYGHKMPNGTWTGLVGDLISGEIRVSN